MQKEEILHIFPDFMRTRWEKVAERAERLQEIRLRVNQPVTQNSPTESTSSA